VLPYANCTGAPSADLPVVRDRLRDLAREQLRHQSRPVAAVIVEPMPGPPDVIPPPEFLQRAQDIAREFGGVFISDEMITGFGRTGRWFACERSGVTPT